MHRMGELRSNSLFYCDIVIHIYIPILNGMTFHHHISIQFQCFSVCTAVSGFGNLSFCAIRAHLFMWLADHDKFHLSCDGSTLVRRQIISFLYFFFWCFKHSICPAITYGSAIWYSPSEVKSARKEIVEELGVIQSRCLHSSRCLQSNA